MRLPRTWSALADVWPSAFDAEPLTDVDDDVREPDPQAYDAVAEFDANRARKGVG
jgi:hypothetical protein